MRFHSIVAFFVRLADAVRTVRGKDTRRTTTRPKPAPFCTHCGERTRPYDPDDTARHRHGTDYDRQH